MENENVETVEESTTTESDIPAEFTATMEGIVNRQEENSGEVASAEAVPETPAGDTIGSAESKQTTEQAVEKAVETEEPEQIDAAALESILNVKPESVKVDSPPDINLNLDADVVGQEVKEALEKTAKELSEQKQKLHELETGLKIEKERLLAEQNQAFTTKINLHFDKFANEMPSLGETSKLTEQQALARKRIFAHAKMECDIRNIPIERALDETIRMFKGVGSEQKAKQELITDINKQKNRMLNTPTRKQTSATSRTFATEEEKIRAEMEDVYNQIGIET